MNKCPRCKLPQEGMYKCQYCGYDLTKDKKRHIKIIRERAKDFIGGLKKGPYNFEKLKNSKLMVLPLSLP